MKHPIAQTFAPPPGWSGARPGCRALSSRGGLRPPAGVRDDVEVRKFRAVEHVGDGPVGESRAESPVQGLAHHNLGDRLALGRLDDDLPDRFVEGRTEEKLRAELLGEIAHGRKIALALAR